jgi:hypothetical protein
MGIKEIWQNLATHLSVSQSDKGSTSNSSTLPAIVEAPQINLQQEARNMAWFHRKNSLAEEFQEEPLVISSSKFLSEGEADPQHWTDIKEQDDDAFMDDVDQVTDRLAQIEKFNRETKTIVLSGNAFAPHKSKE